MNDGKRTLLVGLDAACWPYLNPLLRAGRLPTIERLMTAGVSGILHSTLPAHTPTAWASIITGKNPGQHGVFDMTYRRPGTYDFAPTGAQVRRGTPFWQRLNEHGLRVGLVNVPFTYPADAVEGFVVAGFGAPNAASALTHPPELLAWIEQTLGSYRPTVDAALLMRGAPDQVYAAERRQQQQQVQIAGRLANQLAVDVLVVNLMLLDHANHKMPAMSQVEQAICDTDADLERLLQAFRPHNVMLISDHGARRVKGAFFLHSWLRERGYSVQQPRSPAERLAAMNWVLWQWLRQHYGRSGLPEALARLIARQAARLPQPAPRPLWQAIERATPFARAHVYLSPQLDPHQTTVLPGSAYAGVLYFNLAGREPAGIVAAQERPALADELAAQLMRIEDPDTGQPLFSAVHRGEDLFTGPATAQAPDLVIDSYDAAWSVLSAFRRGASLGAVRNGYFVDGQGDFGQHAKEGLLICWGEDFARRDEPVSGHVMDIPATLLHLCQTPIPEDYDGRVLTEVLAPGLLDRRPLRYQAGDGDAPTAPAALYSAQETAEIAAHLRALGYLG